MSEDDVCALIDFTLAYNPQKIERCFEGLFPGTIETPVPENLRIERWQLRELRRRDAQLKELHQNRDDLDLAIQALENLIARGKARNAAEVAEAKKLRLVGTPWP
jgi:uncharacterized protein YdcH (DUF465 family)